MSEDVFLVTTWKVWLVFPHPARQQPGMKNMTIFAWPVPMNPITDTLTWGN